MKVKLSQIKHNPYNTREDYGDLSGLKASIERLGLTQPFLVRKIDEGYELAFGSRRYEALKEMGVKEVEVDVKEIKSQDMAMLSICENVHRKDLNAVEQARAYDRGMRATKLSLNEFSRIIGVGEYTIKGYLGILRLPKKITEKPDKYTKTQLVCLGRTQEFSESVRIMLENLLENKSLGGLFLNEIVASCGSIFSSSLPLKTKKELCGEVVFHDYSSLPPENYKDIRTFSDAILGTTVAKYQVGLERTKKARAARDRKGTKRREEQIKKVTDIVHIDQKLDDITIRIRETASSVQRAVRGDYYQKASRKSKGKFKTAVNHLVSGIEKILENE